MLKKADYIIIVYANLNDGGKNIDLSNFSITTQGCE